IPFDKAMLRYGTDKPDLRNPLVATDVTEAFRNSRFALFAKAVDQGHVVRAIRAPGAADRPRSFFDKLNEWAREQGAGGLGDMQCGEDGAKGPIAKSLAADRQRQVASLTGAEPGDAVFFVADRPKTATRLIGLTRTRLGEELEVAEKDVFRFCWVVDFPMYEQDEETGKIEFSHNPFSMPQGGLAALEAGDPLGVKAYQYDIVCNGVELSSGAIRNHLPAIMYKAFAIAGYGAEGGEARFGGMLNALKYGAPPHGGSAPGIDRIVMLLAHEPNLREVVAFPMNQKAEDLLMGAPAPVPEERLRELHIRMAPPAKAKSKI